MLHQELAHHVLAHERAASGATHPLGTPLGGSLAVKLDQVKRRRQALGILGIKDWRPNRGVNGLIRKLKAPHLEHHRRLHLGHHFCNDARALAPCSKLGLKHVRGLGPSLAWPTLKHLKASKNTPNTKHISRLYGKRLVCLVRMLRRWISACEAFQQATVPHNTNITAPKVGKLLPAALCTLVKEQAVVFAQCH